MLGQTYSKLGGGHFPLMLDPGSCHHFMLRLLVIVRGRKKKRERRRDVMGKATPLAVCKKVTKCSHLKFTRNLKVKYKQQKAHNMWVKNSNKKLMLDGLATQVSEMGRNKQDYQENYRRPALRFWCDRRNAKPWNIRLVRLTTVSFYTNVRQKKKKSTESEGRDKLKTIFAT